MVQLSEPKQNSREHPRIKTKLLGRYWLADGREFRCTILDVALGGIALTGPGGAFGETEIVYIDQLGRVQGNIVRFFEGGFALKLTATSRATEELAQRLNNLQAHNTLRSFPGPRTIIGAVILGLVFAGAWIGTSFG